MEKATTIFMLTLVSLNFLVVAPYSPLYSAGATYVSGHISENSTWMLEDSPYVATSDIELYSGATLTIEPGVEVRFDGNFSLVVYGSLSAIGTNTNPITFTSNRAEPSAGDWNTIKFLGGHDTSFILKYCVVQCALSGVTIQSQQIAVIESSEISYNLYSGISVIGQGNLLIANNIIELNEYGITGSGVISSGFVVTNNTILNNNYGVNIRTSGAKPLINNMTFINNDFSNNRYGIYLYSGTPPPSYSLNSYITNFVISNNLFSSGEYGLYFETRSWGSNSPSSRDNSYIYNGVISNNTMFISKYGIYIYSGGAWYRYVYNVTLSDNVISENNVGTYLDAHHYELVQFDVTITSNDFSSNEIGIHVTDTVKTNITKNSISHNSYGITYVSTKTNLASRNDIYLNTLYGMHVAQNATVNAEDNFWGEATGPYHPELNPSGKGNRVNGVGTDLDFQPYLVEPIGHINHPPVPRLQVDKTQVRINEVVTFNASASSDDDTVDMYFFDFGDGTNSNWTAASTVTHRYLSHGIFRVSLSVVDNLGVKSSANATGNIVVIEEFIPLIILIRLNTTLLLPNKDLAIAVLVTSEDDPVAEAAVTLSSEKGGTFSPPFGMTGSDGYFNSTFTPPTVTTQTFCNITANATKSAYLGGQNQSQVILMSARQTEGGPNYDQALLVITVGASIAVAATIVMKRRKKGKRLAISKERRSVKSAK